MLSGAVGADQGALRKHRKILLKRIDRKFGFKGVHVLSVRTSEGNGVLHELWAWLPSEGEKSRSFHVPQRWLSKQWGEIHGATYVWIKKYRYGEKSKKHLARYVVSQYVGDQCGFVDSTVSNRLFGFPLRKTFLRLCRSWRCRNHQRLQAGMKQLPFQWVKDTWAAVMRGEVVTTVDGVFALDGAGTNRIRTADLAF